MLTATPIQDHNRSRTQCNKPGKKQGTQSQGGNTTVSIHRELYTQKRSKSQKTEAKQNQKNFLKPENVFS